MAAGGSSTTSEKQDHIDDEQEQPLVQVEASNEIHEFCREAAGRDQPPIRAGACDQYHDLRHEHGCINAMRQTSVELVHA